MSEKTETGPEAPSYRELLAQLELCCHFLHHRRGGRYGQARLLRMLSERGQTTQRELQELLHIQSGSMSELVGKLESAGLLLRTRSQEDRRQVLLQISAPGLQALERHEQENRLQEERLFTALSPQEQRQLYQLLEKLLDAWRTQYDRALFNHRGAEMNNEEAKKTC